MFAWRELLEEVAHILPPDRVRLDEPMKAHTSFGIGGPADLFLLPRHVQDLRRIVTACAARGVPLFVMGNGTNLLVRDGGMRGVVVCLAAGFDRFAVQGCRVECGCGVSLAKACALAGEAGLSGLEFAVGIPGTVGGAVVMNAGAYGGEMKDVVTEVSAMGMEGDVRRLARDELAFGYRTSILQAGGLIVTEVFLELSRGDRVEIRRIMEDLRRRREEKQPLGQPSAGSVFRRPPGHYVGSLVEACGLKGARVGGAQVSPKHGGFIVNTGDARADDVLRLMELVRGEVRRQFGVELVPEIKVVGDA